MRTAYVSLLLLSIGATTVSAEPQIQPDRVKITGQRRPDQREFQGYVGVKPDRFRRSTVQRTRLLYLNGCFNTGCTITPGFENSIENTSAIVQQTSQISGFQFGQDNWNKVVSCMRETFAPFDVVITTEDPSPMPHFEVIIAGSPTEVGFQLGVLGVAPIDKEMCSVIDNSISYAFANVFDNQDMDDICSTAAQEVAHTFGLDHEFLCEDPMTYLTNCPTRKRFQNKPVRCGEFEERDCICGKTEQNSLVQIMKIFGPREKTPPNITLLEPKLGEQVAPGFRVRAEVEEDIAVGTVELWIDGKKWSEVKEPKDTILSFRAPLELENGDLTVEIRAADIFGAKALSQVKVKQMPLCATADECGAGDTCVHGRCCAGPDVAGGLGNVCASETDCKGGLCVAGTDDKEALCTEPCILGGDGCPDGFACEEHGADTPVCWPVPQSSGGCQTQHPSPLWLSLLLVFLVPLVRRRARA